jgi:hypothetical protein
MHQLQCDYHSFGIYYNTRVQIRNTIQGRYGEWAKAAAAAG